MTNIQSSDYFAIIPEWVLQADISANAVRLYGILNRFANGNGRAWPSRNTLADLMRVSKGTIDRAKTELVDIGALLVEQRTNPAGDPSSNLYTLLIRPFESSQVMKGIPMGGYRGSPTDDDLNRVSMKQSQTAKSSPMKPCSACLGKNRDIEGKEGLSCVYTRNTDGKNRVSYTYIICPQCDGSGVAA